MRGLLLLLSALLLLESTDGNKEYDQLSAHDTNIIDKAIIKANEKYGATKHLDYDSILKVNSEKRMLHVLLKPTSCKKMTPSVHRKDCKIQNKARPHISCVECRGDMYCSPLKEIEQIKQIISSCEKIIHHVGGVNLLSQKSENQQQTGCLGCI